MGFWVHRSLPVIQGKLQSDGDSVRKDDHLEGYDSGIDSTINGATSSNGDIENEESTKAYKCEEKVNKKGKKRKREEVTSNPNPNLDLDASNIESENSPKKKGKKRKREEEILNLDTSNATNDDSVNSPAKKKKKK